MVPILDGVGLLDDINSPKLKSECTGLSFWSIASGYTPHMPIIGRYDILICNGLAPFEVNFLLHKFLKCYFPSTRILIGSKKNLLA